MTKSRTALIIGGGIAGPAVAMALQQAGFDALVYEARPSAATGAGGFLTVASNGLVALRVLAADGPVLTGGFATPHITLRSGTGKRLGQSRTGHTPPAGPASRTIRRADLYRMLHERATSRGIRVEHGKRLVTAAETSGGVRAVFTDGSEAVGELLVGCDGVHSTVRRIIDPAARAPVYAGLLSTGGYAGRVPVDVGPGGYEMIFGRRAFFGYTVASDGQVWWFANVPQRDEPARGEAEAIGADARRRHLLRLFAADAGPAVSIIQATDDLLPLSPVHAIRHLPAWHSGRMIVIGDAAHAPSPTSGQGASLAVEDAVMLAKCLRDSPGLNSAFDQFEEARRPRVERIVTWAARINSSKAAGPVSRVIRDAMLPAVLKLTANSRAHERVYDYRVEWDERTREQ